MHDLISIQIQLTRYINELRQNNVRFIYLHFTDILGVS